MRTLIITNSNDGTTDLLIHLLQNEAIFRLNYDQWNEFKISLTNDEVIIENKFHKISAKEITKVYWRKPFANDFQFDKIQDDYLNREVQYIFKEIWNRFHMEGKTVLVNPESIGKIGKMSQLLKAKQYFQVPKWELTINNTKSFSSKKTITKSLSSSLFSKQKFLYTSLVDTEQLNTNYPWFLQEAISASHDLTVVFINGKCFAYSFDRAKLNDIIDWRQQENPNRDWQPFKLSKLIEANIMQYMFDLNLKFGRLDFLLYKSNYFFLEVNPNGQYAWLDLENKNGLMKSILNEISPYTSTITRPE